MSTLLLCPLHIVRSAASRSRSRICLGSQACDGTKSRGGIEGMRPAARPSSPRSRVQLFNYMPTKRSARSAGRHPRNRLQRPWRGRAPREGDGTSSQQPSDHLSVQWIRGREQTRGSFTSNWWRVIIIAFANGEGCAMAHAARNASATAALLVLVAAALCVGPSRLPASTVPSYEPGDSLCAQGILSDQFASLCCEEFQILAESEFDSVWVCVPCSKIPLEWWQLNAGQRVRVCGFLLPPCISNPTARPMCATKAEVLPVAVENSSWGRIKALYPPERRTW